jgi:hypothetical protein
MKKNVGDFHLVESSYETIGVSEAMLAPTLSEIVESNPHDSIYLKTHPLGYSRPVKHILDSEPNFTENAPRIRVQLISKGHNKVEVERRFNNISKILSEEISRLKGEIVEVQSAIGK